jgi:hypothetical protein
MRVRHAAAFLSFLMVSICAPAAAQQNPVPFLQNPLSPSSAAPGSAGFTLSVNGAGFVNGAVVNWNGSPRQTTFVSNTQLTALIPASDLASAATVPVTVSNPAPGGGRSNVVTFEVTTPASTLAFNRTDTNFADSQGSPGINSPTSLAVAYFPGFIAPNLEIASQGCPAHNTCVLDHGYVTTIGPNAALTLTVAAPNSIVTGDFNGDGFYDLLSVGSTFSISLGRSLNAFDIPKSYSLPGDINSSNTPVVGDFNRDGRLDLVMGQDTGVYFLQGNGDGTFGTPVLIQTDAAALGTQFVAGDFNGDGILDLAVCNFDLTGSTVSILLGNGDGTFVPQASYALNLYVGQIAAADFNGDGKLDLAILDSNNSSASLSILLGNGDGTFKPKTDYPGGVSPLAIALGDYNGDGRLDIAVTDTLCIDSGCPASGAVNVFLGNGDGTFQSSLVFATQAQPAAIVSGEFVQSGSPVGRSGLVAANPSASTVSIFSAIPPAVISNPLPTISSVSPGFAIQNSGALTLTITGTNFVSGSVVSLDGQAKPTTFVSPTQVTAQIPSTVVAIVGAHAVLVKNPAPGGGDSAAGDFSVYYASPTISSISSSSVVAGSPSFLLTINGVNFAQGVTLDFNGVVQPSTLVSSTQLTTTVSASQIAVPAQISIVVTNPALGANFSSGGTSPAVMLTILSPSTQPVLGPLSPASATAGGPAFTLTITGSGFSAQSTVTFGSLQIVPGFDSSKPNVLQAPIPLNAVAMAGTPLVIVTNPGGIPSVPISFFVNNPLPAIATLSPTSAAPGSGPIVLNITGTNFNSSSVVEVGTASLATTLVSATSLTAILPANAMTPGATLNIAVNNPAPAGGTTPALPFTIADFSVTAPTSSATVNAGQPGNFVLSVVPANGSLAGTVSFSASGLPANATASFSPNSLPGGSKGTNVTLSIATMAHSAGIFPNAPRADWPLALELSVLIFLILAMGIGLRAANISQRRYAPQFLLLLLLSIASAMAACGSVAGNSTPALNTGSGTPAGTYQITVTAASANVPLTMKVTLTVQ